MPDDNRFTCLFKMLNCKRGENNMKKKLVCGIIFVLILLALCMAVDSADENITISSNYTGTSMVKLNDTNKVLLVNESDSYFTVKSNDKVHMVAPKYPIVGMYAKPSCGCKYSYKYWYYKEFVNYCPNCHHYNVLVKNPKGTYEREWTCRRCSSDFCGVCGKEKMSYSNVYLRRA